MESGIRCETLIEYNISTLSAGSLLKHYKVKTVDGKAGISFELDFSDSRERRRYIKVTDAYKDNAMFYQIRAVMREREKIAWDEDSLKRIIIFVDFETTFNNMTEANPRELGDSFTEDDLKVGSKIISDEYRVRSLFEKGIYIKYGEGLTIHFIPFDKSNSMSRQSKMSFIDESLLDELNHRLNLDITFENQPINLSKYYAYRGLYLSSATRVDTKERVFNSNTVIIINDAATNLAKQHIITATADENNKRKWNMREINNFTFKIDKVFDGEGIISPKYSEIINRTCGYNGATSFQIRMPFVKGMLHQVDFHAFIKEVAGDVETFYVTDAFGVKRDLLQAEIIMPESMFKCKKWLQKELVAVGKSKCMDYYFEKFYEYEHALYISNTNLIYGKTPITKLNYQFLNTLALNDNEFDSLMREHVKWAEHPFEYFRYTEPFKHTENNDSTEEDDSLLTGSEYAEYDDELWKLALECDEVFAHEYKVKNVLEGLSEGLRLDCARGKIVVKGEIRYLSRDLLAFLIDLVKENLDDDEIIKLQQQCIYNDKFFMPGAKIDLEIKKHYPIFRNPHLSRNEQCVLEPYLKGKKKAKKDLYYRYFAHLTGIFMVSYQSLVPQALGGADFDGDIVRIIDDSRVRNAILRGTYEDYRRKLPIIVIPPAGGTKLDTVTSKVSFAVIKDTFSNKIGQISNLSIRLGSKEYGAGEKLEHSCAECTILTGLEIDAAKSGEHPDLTDIIKYGRELKQDFDYVSKFKEKIDDLSKKRFRISAKNIVGECKKYQIKWHIYDPDPLVEYEYDDSYRNLDKLPMYYADIFSSGIELPETDKKISGRYIFFDFLQDKDWKKSIDCVLQQQIGAVMAAYAKLEEFSSRLFKYRQKIEKGNYEGHIRTILKMQYDYEDYEEKIDDEIGKIWAFADATFDSRKSVEEAMEVLFSESRWAFLLQDEKKATLLKVLNIEDETDLIELLTNFDARGYNLLFFILKDILTLKMKEMTDKEILEEMTDKNTLENDSTEKASDQVRNKVDSSYYNKFYPQLYKYYILLREENDTNWKKKLLKICNKEIQELVKNLSDDQKLIILYSLKGNGPDKSSLFFWSNVTEEAIRRHIN